MDNRYNDINAPRVRGGIGTGLGAIVGALVLSASIAGWSMAGSASGGRGTAPVIPAAAPAAAAERTLGSGVDSYAELVDQVSPAVVTIRSERRVQPASQALPPGHPFREFFGEQFGQRQQPERRSGGVGSGVIVRQDGYILTNNHVIQGAETVRVELTDGRSFVAKVIGNDAPTDLAVLKIDGANLQTLALGDSDHVRVGDVVLAVGNPLGIGQTVTMGIVSAKGRATGAGDGSFEDFIQTDAPINRGNSGGALVNTHGQLVGINSQILSPSGGNIGIGFAIPANMARTVMNQLIEHGTVRRSMLGVTIQPVTSDIARSLGLGEVRGALINGVQPGSAAEKGGLRRGDVVTAVNGSAVRDANDLRNHVAHLEPGSKATVTVVRDGRERQVDVTLAELDAQQSASRERGGTADPTGIGMSVERLTPERARQLRVQATSGVLVTAVQPSGRAAAAGLQAGDVIEEVDGAKVESADALRAALGTGDRPALLLVHRGEATLFLTVERRE